MNAMQIFSSPAAQALGWTIIHSLWQGLICLAACLVALRCIPANWSRARYLIATSALMIFLFSSVATFFYLNGSTEQISREPISLVHFTTSVESVQTQNSYLAGLLRTITLAFQHYLPMIVICWGIGTVLFTIRLLGGWVTVKRLKASAIAVNGEWTARLQQLARSLEINTFVQFAESAIVQAPLVIGYFKPVVLIPFGMIGGLSTEQLESIIIHELIHIRRHDYVVNLLQSVLEAVFFFNPFVWIVSGIIRREREHCCDDAVIALHGNRLAYAHALTALEEARLSRTGLALSLAEDKNQLLNRIKRIMEKSVKPYSLRERIVPAILLVTGLICASWLTINTDRSESKQRNPANTTDNGNLAADTTIRIEKTGRYFKKTLTTVGEDGKLHEEVVEEVDGEEPFAPLSPIDFELAIPAIDAIPSVDMLAAMPALPDFTLELNMADTVPFMGPGFHGMISDFEKFSKEFETEFREKFGCTVRVPDTPADMHSIEQWADKVQLQALDAQLSMLKNEEMWVQHEKQMKNFGDQMERWAEENAKQFEALDAQFQALENSRGVFEKEFRDELVKDGYLKENEELKNIEIHDESMTINGKKIKDSDLKKYKNLLKKNNPLGFKPAVPAVPGRRE